MEVFCELDYKDRLEIIVSFLSVFIPLVIFLITIGWQKRKERKNEERKKYENVEYLIEMINSLLKSLQKQISFSKKFYDKLNANPYDFHLIETVAMGNIKRITSKINHLEFYYSLLYYNRQEKDSSKIKTDFISLIDQLDFFELCSKLIHIFGDNYTNEYTRRRKQIHELNEKFVNQLEGIRTVAFNNNEKMLLLILNEPYKRYYGTNLHKDGSLVTLQKTLLRPIIDDFVNKNMVNNAPLLYPFFTLCREISMQIDSLKKYSTESAKGFKVQYIDKYSESIEKLNRMTNRVTKKQKCIVMNDIKQITINNRVGTWRYEDETKLIEVNITNERYSVKITENGNEILDFETDAWFHWLDVYLLDWRPENRFYLRYADDEKMIFGRHKTEVAGDLEWEHEFERVQ